MWMGAIDDVDLLLSFCSCRTQLNKWWHAIFWFLIDISVVNTLHLWCIDNAEEAAQWSHRKFIMELIKDLLERHGELQTEQRNLSQQCRCTRILPRQVLAEREAHIGLLKEKDVLACYARLEEHYFPDKKERGNCASCYHCYPVKSCETEKQVVWWCPKCKVHLPVPECFTQWHTVKNPKSPFV